MWRKIFNANLLLFLISTIFTLLLAEFLVRTFSPRHNIWDYKVPTIQEGWKMTSVPNTTFRHLDPDDEYNVEVEINEYGFRDKNDLKKSKEKDVMILGDSFCFGYGVEEEERFGNILQKKTTDSLEVFNVATPNCHFLTYQKNLEYAKELGLQAKKMVFGVCMENDILEYHNITLPQLPKGFKKIKYWFHRNSSLYAFVGEKLHNSRIVERFLSWMGIMNDNSINTMTLISEEAVSSAVEKVVEIVKDYEAIILIIPSRYLWLEGYGEKAIEVHENFIRQLRSKSLKVIDMKPIFDEESSDVLHEIYFYEDGHWNQRGHELAAEEIYKQLELK